MTCLKRRQAFRPPRTIKQVLVIEIRIRCIVADLPALVAPAIA
jgi:hypothetical protein